MHCEICRHFYRLEGFFPSHLVSSSSSKVGWSEGVSLVYISLEKERQKASGQFQRLSEAFESLSLSLKRSHPLKGPGSLWASLKDIYLTL